MNKEDWNYCEVCVSCQNCSKIACYDCNGDLIGDCAGCDPLNHSDFSPLNFCYNCGRPLTEEAWKKLERRLCGE